MWGLLPHLVSHTVRRCYRKYPEPCVACHTIGNELRSDDAWEVYIISAWVMLELALIFGH